MFNFNALVTGLVKNLLSPRTWAWAASTYLLYRNCTNMPLCVSHCIISVFLMGGKSLQDALNVMIKERADVDIKIGEDK